MKRRNDNERGFALLLVFAMAAAVAILLYAELPRAAFESQRNKEEMLIERGEQYTRAIQLYITSFKKYPQTLDELEKNPRQRFLRRRYIDPMTGSDEWRLIHATNGVLTDSKIKKQDKEKKAENTFITESASIGATAPSGGSTGANMANRRRQSDGPLPPPGATDGFNPQANQPTNPQDPNAPPQDPNAPAAGTPGQQQPNTTLPPGLRPGGILPGAPGSPGQPGAQQQTQPGQPGQNAQQQQQNYGQITAGAAIGALPPSPQQQQGSPAAGGYPTQPAVQQGRAPGPFGGPAAAIPGQAPNAGTNPALNLIGQILTTPNPAMNPAANAPQTGGGVVGSGIVGVASKYEGDSIKIYNERQKYDEWEFFYDPKKDTRNKANMPQTGNNLPGGQLPNTPPGNNPGGPQPPGSSSLK